MKKAMRTTVWLMAILLATLANGATAGLIVTGPVVNEDPNQHLIVAGDKYTSITITSGPYYGMAALLIDGPPANIYIGPNDDPNDRQTLVTNITVDNVGWGAQCMFAPGGTIYAGDITGDLIATSSGGAYGMDADSVDVGVISGKISATATTGGDAVGISGRYWDTVWIDAIGATGVISASAEGSYALGICSDNGHVYIPGGIAGTIIADTNSHHAFGIAGRGVEIGDISGIITATATDDYAYGIYAWQDSVTTGEISGSITADSNNNAYGIRNAEGDVDIASIAETGSISATAGDSGAYGIYSDGDDVTTGHISGSITATAGGDDAYGIYADGDVTIDSVTETGSISATAGGHMAIGIGTNPDLPSGASVYVYIPGGIAGTITADAGGGDGIGIFTRGDIVIGDITGDVNVTAILGEAAGFYAGGDIAIGDISGTVTATAGGPLATGMLAIGSVATGDISGKISATTSGGYMAYGIWSDNNDVTIASITETGSISATAGGDEAYGISGSSVYIPGGIAGTITADANNYAYGINATGDVTIGDISGSITATVAGEEAFGIFAGGDLEIGDVTGTVRAEALGAYADADTISAYGNISIGDITGNVISIGGSDTDAIWSHDGSVSIGDITGMVSSEAGQYGGYAIGAGGDYVHIDSISGSVVAATAGNAAYGIYSWDAYVDIGDVSGTISAEATTGSYAYAVYAYGDVTIDSVTETGSISATAGGDGAYGIYSNSIDSVYIPGGIAGIITADANNDAYGIYSDGVVEIGGISGSITATAADSNAYGISAGGAVDTGDISGSISATAGSSNAYGISAGDDITIDDITGAISAEATTGSNARAISADGDVEIDFIAAGALIEAYAALGDAYGIAAGDDIYIGPDVHGEIAASTGSGSNAYAIYAGDDLYIAGDISSDGYIHATAGGGNAYGIAAGDDLSVAGDIDGTITATANGGSSDAYGIYAYHNVNIDDITGDITATADGDGAYGISGADDPMEPGQYVEVDDISGIITASAGGNEAYGITSRYGSLDTGDISGTVSATADGSGAYGLAAMFGLHTDDLSGTISATAGSDAYGIWADGDIDITSIGDDGYISAWADGSYAYGVYGVDELAIGYIGGDVEAGASADAYGIYSASHAAIGDISGSVTADAIGSRAYGIYGDSDITIGDISGTIGADAGDSYAYGIRSGNDISIGDIGGSIGANADWSRAYGITAGHDISIGDISGSIRADTGWDQAYAISGNDISIGDISGSIGANAVDNRAYGIVAGNSIEIGVITGGISAEATTGNTAYGMYAGSDISIDSIRNYGYDRAISAYAGNNNAYGIYAGGDVYVGSISSDYYGYGYTAIDAYAEGSGAYGIYAGGDVSIGNISDYYGYSSYSTIDAYAGDGDAYGIYAGGDVSIDSISGYGSVEASAEGSDARAINAGGDVSIDSISGYGSVEASAEGSDARAINAGGDISIGSISGYSSIEASAYDDAEAISGNNVTIGGIAVGSHVSAWADYEGAYGIYSEGSTDTGTIAGDVYAGADHDYAVAIYVGGTLDTTVTGSVEAETYNGTEAIALSAYDSMDIFVDGGSVIGRGYDGEDEEWMPAWAIRSGTYGEGWMDQDADDTVEITAGSYIYGDIDLGGSEDYDYLGLYAGSGTGYIEGDMANIEDIYIDGGTWYVLGDAYNNYNGIYMDGGVLNWQGSVEDLWIDGGTFSPGNSIGTTTVLGDFWLDSDTIFVVEVDDDENADLVDVSGTVYLEGGTIQPVLEDGEYFITHPFQATVISAEGGLGEGYERFVEEWNPFFDYDVIYDTSDPCDSLVVLGIERAGFFAETKNEHAVAGALDHVIAGGDMDEDTHDLLLDIRYLQHNDWEEGGNGNPRLLDELTPQDTMGLAQVTSATMGAFNDSMFDRINNMLTGRPFAAAGFGQKLLAKVEIRPDEWLIRPGSQPTDKWMPFIKGIGSWGDKDGEKGVSGYRYNVYGMTAGADKLIDDNWLVGIAFGGSRADVDYDKAGTSADIDTAMVALYGSYFKDNWHIDLDLSYGYNWYDSERTVQIGMFNKKARSDHNGNVYSAAIQAGMNLGNDCTIIEPIVGAGYAAIQEDGYTEKGADPVNLKVDSHTTDSYYAKLGVRLAALMREQDNVVLVPEIGVFYIADLSDESELDSAFGDGSAFTVEGLEPDDALNVKAAINAYFSNNWRLFLNYDWRTASDLNTHTVKGGVQWDF